MEKFFYQCVTHKTTNHHGYHHFDNQIQNKDERWKEALTTDRAGGTDCKHDMRLLMSLNTVRLSPYSTLYFTVLCVYSTVCLQYCVLTVLCASQ